MPAVEFLNSKTMLTKILLTHTRKLNIAFNLTLAITPKLTKVHIKYIQRRLQACKDQLSHCAMEFGDVSRVKSVLLTIASYCVIVLENRDLFTSSIARRYVVASCHSVDGRGRTELLIVS